MNLPDFVVVGAQKAGSTTIYEDLFGHPQVFLADKELGYLLDQDLLTPSGRLRYASLFKGADKGRVIGDVSADYAKLPETAGMAERTVDLLGPRVKFVYSIRNPVDRLVSQHHHELVRGIITEPDVDRAVIEVPTLIDRSRYAMQMEPFRRLVGHRQVLVLCFEEYMGDRVAGFAELARFLELSPTTTTTDPGQAFNVARASTVATGPLRRVLQSRFYRSAVRPLLSREMRSTLRQRILTPVPLRPSPPSKDTVERILDELVDDQAALASTGFVAPESWTREATHERYARLRADAGQRR
jgi:hypothetical protein